MTLSVTKLKNKGNLRSSYEDLRLPLFLSLVTSLSSCFCIFLRYCSDLEVLVWRATYAEVRPPAQELPAVGSVQDKLLKPVNSSDIAHDSKIHTCLKL
jgi:hypothetical protein